MNDYNFSKLNNIDTKVQEHLSIMEFSMFNYISVNPEICGGKPCIKGTRIPVFMVLELLEQGITFDRIIRDYYPQLNIEQIKACIEYANFLVKEEDIYFVEESIS